jgi:multisubunit Na+/H+ antiporter MnhB subunit
MSNSHLERSAILEITARWFLPILGALSLLILFRGHNAPGGGFIGGLTAAAGFGLSAFASGVAVARARLVIAPQRLIGFGLLTAVLSGFPGLVSGGPFLEPRWVTLPLFGLLEWKTGTVFLFDCGVYLVVLGVMSLVIFSALEEQEK